MRSFTLERGQDESGISGCGLVLEGCEFSDGHVSVCWITGLPHSTANYDSLADFLAIHVSSHPANHTVIRYSDGETYTQ